MSDMIRMHLQQALADFITYLHEVEVGESFLLLDAILDFSFLHSHLLTNKKDLLFISELKGIK